jgi:hypothetical protein
MSGTTTGANASHWRVVTCFVALGTVIFAIGLTLSVAGVSHRSPDLGTAASGEAQGSLVPQVNATYSHSFSGSCNPTRTSVHFFANASGAVAPYNFSWNFGDGSPNVFLQNPVHSFASPGLYTPVLTVTDANGYSNGTILSLFVPAPPCAASGAGSGTQAWVLDGVVAGFVVGACGLVVVASRRWRE